MRLSDYLIQLIILIHLSIIGIINPKVAERARRMLFLTSLATALAQEGIIKRNVLDTINSELRLAKNEHCLLLGKELSRCMWRTRSFKCEFVEDGWETDETIPNNGSKGRYLPLDDIRIISTRFVKAAPKWVKYDTRRMQDDVTDLFMTHPVLDNSRVAM